MKQLLETVSWQPLIGALVTCCSLIATLLMSRTNRWLRKLLADEQLANEKQIAALHERELLRSNATLRVLTETSESAERVTLESLLSNERADFSVESSPEPSTWAPSERPRDPAPLKPTSRASGSHKATDWSDDDEPTAPAPISSYPPPWPRESKP